MGQPTIGDNLARLRHFRALTQEQLAAAAGVSIETIRKMTLGASSFIWAREGPR